MTQPQAREHLVPGPAGPLRVRTAGDPEGPAVLLVHPINLRSDCWAPLIGHLPDDRHYLAPDLRGHGGSTADGPFGWAHWVADCLAVVDHFGPADLEVIGGSLGGTIGLGVALERPALVRSVLVMGSAARSGVKKSAVLDLLDELGVAGMFRRAFRDFTFGPGTPDEVIENAIAMANPNPVEVVRQVWLGAQRTDIRDRATAISAPVTVLTGAADTTCPPERGRELAAVTGGDFLMLPGVGHMPMLEAPELVARHWSAHLERAARSNNDAGRFPRGEGSSQG